MQANSDELPFEYLSWDSDFFGLKIGRITQVHVDSETMGRGMKASLAAGYDCLYWLCEFDVEMIRVAEKWGYQLTDIRLCLEQELPPVSPEYLSPESTFQIRTCQPDDYASLRAIAKQSHTNTRFYADTGFPPERCGALYETWIERSCQGYADVVLVATENDVVAGYITCHLKQRPDGVVGDIGLLAVDDAFRGRGLGLRLVQHIMNWCREQGVTRMEVVTQGGSPGAQRLYQKCGFITKSVGLWYHVWPQQRNLTGQSHT